MIEPQAASAPGGGRRRPETARATAPGICHLISSNFLGGPEKQILEHCVQLQRAGWRAVVGSFRENRSQVEVTEAARARGLPLFLVDTRSPFSLLAVWQLRRFLAAERIDVLVTHGYKSNVVGWLACRRRRPAQVSFVRGFTAENWKVRRYEALDRWVLRRLPRLLCVSEGTRRLLARAGIPSDRVTVVHNAVECDLAAGVREVDLRAEFSLPSASAILVAAGRLSPEKGHRVLLEAMALLADHEPPVHLVLLGNGAEEANLRRQAQENGSAQRVVFAGFRRDVLGCLAGADVVVNPSFSEGLPNVLLEAFSLGKPTVATDVGGTAELVQHGRTGWLVRAGEAPALAAAIRAVLDDGALAASVAAAARRRAAEEFSFVKQTEKLMRFYRSLLEAPDHAARGATATRSRP